MTNTLKVLGIAKDRLTDETTREFIDQLVAALGDWTRQLQTGEKR